MTNEVFNNLGIWVGIIGACAVLAIVQGLLILLIGVFGKSIWKKLTRLYALHVVWYWLNRLEKEGTHTFEKARAEARPTTD